MESEKDGMTTKVADFFDIMKIKSSYPKVKINLLANFH